MPLADYTLPTEVDLLLGDTAMLKKILCLLLIIPAFSYANDCSRLTASSNTEYPPYLWHTNTQPVQLEGLLVAFMQRLGEVAGISIDTIYAGPWVRTQSQAHDGKLDLIAAFYTDGRAQWLDYLHPEVIQTQSAVWINKKNPFVFNQLSDLKNRTGLSVIGNSLGQEFDNYANENLVVTEVSSVHQALRMMEEQRADYLVYELEPGRAYSMQLNTNEVISLAKPVSSEVLFLAFSKQSKCNTELIKEKLSAALQQALQENWAEELINKAQLRWQHLQNSN